MPSQQQSVGIKISSPGWDSRTCPDYELIFNSSWPALPIAFDRTVTVSYNGFGQPTPATVDHNLGFVPLTMGWGFSDTSMTLALGRFFPAVSKTTIYLQSGPAGITTAVNLKCYNIDITHEQNYVYTQALNAQLPYDPTYGIKVNKEGKSINSSDMRDFILHSRTASPQVLAIVTEASLKVTGAGFNYGTLSYTNPKGYIPWAFGYVVIVQGGVETYVWASPGSQAYPRLILSDTVSMIVANVPPTALPKASIIILRDPLFAPNDVQVTY